MSTSVSATAAVRALALRPAGAVAHAAPSPPAFRPQRKLAGHHSLDQPGVDQQPVEAAGLGAAGALEKQSVAALQNFLLFGERRIERQAGRLLHDQRKIGRLQPVERRRQILRREVDRVDGVVGREVARVVAS